MGFDPRDDEVVHGGAAPKPKEQRPIDKEGQSLWGQKDASPAWGSQIDAALERKRGLPSRVPGYGGYRTRKPGG